MPERKGRPGQLIWTDDMRIALLLLWEMEQNTAQRLRIFNDLFKQHIAGCGLPGLIDANRLYSQYGECKKARPPASWRAILEPVDPNGANTQKQRMRRLVEDAIAGLHKAITPVTGPVDAHSATVSSQPPATPRRKRAREPIPSGASSLGPDQQTRPRCKRSRTSRTPPALSTFAELPTPPWTPKAPRLNASAILVRPSGSSVPLTPEKRNEALQPCAPVAPSLVHIEHAGLLFRYWDEHSQIKLENGEFKAPHYRTFNLVPPSLPPSDSPHFPWAHFGAHLNRDHFEAELISTSNFLIWTIRLALKQRENGAKDGHISFIDASTLDKRKVYYIPPIHKELCKRRAFDKGAWCYHGSHEFAVFHHIPAHAVVHTVSVQSLIEVCTQLPSVRSLGIELLQQKGKYREDIHKRLQAMRTTLTPPTISAIAKIINRSGFSIHSPSHFLSHLVADLIRGLAIQIPYSTPAEWRQISAWFANVLLPQPDRFDVQFKARQTARFAFLDGVRWSCGPWNARHSAQGIRAVMKQAAALGLSDVAGLLAGELEEAMAELREREGRNTGFVERGTAALPSSTDRDGARMVVMESSETMYK